MSTRDGATTEQIRHNIDQGRSGDKVRGSDPAVAPLGTDEEAAGTPIDPAVLKEVRDREARFAKPTDDQRSSDGDFSGVLAWVVIVVAFFTVLIGSILLLEI